MERANCAPAPRLSNEMARKPSKSVQAGFLEVELTAGPLLKPGAALAACKTLARGGVKTEFSRGFEAFAFAPAQSPVGGERRAQSTWPLCRPADQKNARAPALRLRNFIFKTKPSERQCAASLESAHARLREGSTTTP